MNKYIDKKTIVALKRRAKIESIVAQDVPLKRVGEVLSGPSPIPTRRGRQEGQIEVRPGIQRFACPGGNLNGDVIRYIRLRHDLSFVQACRRLADMIGFDLETDPDQVSLELN